MAEWTSKYVPVKLCQTSGGALPEVCALSFPPVVFFPSTLAFLGWPGKCLVIGSWTEQVAVDIVDCGWALVVLTFPVLLSLISISIFPNLHCCALVICASDSLEVSSESICTLNGCVSFNLCEGIKQARFSITSSLSLSLTSCDCRKLYRCCLFPDDCSVSVLCKNYDTICVNM